ncbi:hypothetical protein D5W64_12550 [Salmonella enterica subsp. enterica serovar Saintpaul]|nr:hypothetical protein [Salmonella enterica subsp. enterica serovar Saintpaul]
MFDVTVSFEGITIDLSGKKVRRGPVAFDPREVEMINKYETPADSHVKITLKSGRVILVDDAFYTVRDRIKSECKAWVEELRERKLQAELEAIEKELG